jgi:hypothetical protein
MGLPRLGEGIFGCDRDLEFRPLHRLVQTLELVRTGDVTIQAHADPVPRAREGLHAIQVRDPASVVVAKGIDAMLERVTTGERQDGVDAIRREASGGGRDVSGASVDYDVGA